MIGTPPTGFATFSDPASNFRGTIQTGPGGTQFSFGNRPQPEFPWLTIIIVAAIVIAISEG